MPDDVVAISDAIRIATAGVDAVLVQGGLGPTSDDLSREGIAAASGVPLHRDADIEKRLRAWYAERNRPVLDVSLRMADVPDGAEVLPNPSGQAPGLRTVLDGCLIYAVPGVPREMQAIVTESVLPDLIARATARPDVLTQTLRIAVRGESEVAKLVAAGGPTPPGLRVAYLARPGDVRLRVTGPAKIEEPYAQQLRTLLGELVYGEGDDTLDVVVHRLLATQGATLAVAESLTGGQLGETLTRMAGSSATFVGGVVAYETRLKTMLLGVDGASQPGRCGSPGRGTTDGRGRAAAAGEHVRAEHHGSGRSRTGGRARSRHGLRRRGGSGRYAGALCTPRGRT